MLVKGVKEWCGKEAEIFIDTRNKIESVLREQKYDYFYSGIVSNKSIYEANILDLGERFINNCVEFKLGEDDVGTIIAPEGTFRVYDYLIRERDIKNSKGKIFYSQEFLRNEPSNQIAKGKTISFWQTGFEIFGFGEIESSVEALETVMNCFNACGLSNAFYRITDKRILKGIVSDLSLKQQRYIYELIDDCNDDGDKFQQSYINQGGDKEVAKRIGQLLNLGKIHRLSLETLKSFTDNSLSHAGVAFIKQIIDNLSKKDNIDNIKIVPFMGKSWDACNSFMFDVRLPDYEYAVAGGGNLHAFNDGEFVTNKSGAGIGVTRIAEYLISKYNGKGG